jgi:hypothetical protein
VFFTVPRHHRCCRAVVPPARDFPPQLRHRSRRRCTASPASISVMLHGCRNYNPHSRAPASHGLALSGFNEVARCGPAFREQCSMARTKTTGLAAFTNRGSALAAPDEAPPAAAVATSRAPAHAPAAAGRARGQAAPAGRKRGQGATVAPACTWRAPIGGAAASARPPEGVSLQKINRARAVAGVHIQRPARHRRMTY